MSSSLQDLHRVELNILNEFKRVCEVLEIPYFACYGTALGAVRHQGFIPWDDDLDVGMLRKDYQKFLKEAPAILQPHFFLQNFDTENDYYLSHAKIRDSRTTFIEECWKDFQWNHGVFIDIFPIDYVPDNCIQRLLVKIKRKYYQNAICVWGDKNFGALSGWKNKLRSIFQLYVNRAYEKRVEIISRFDAMLAALPPSTRVAVYECPYVYPAEYFASFTEHPFEDTTIKLPKLYHEYLRATYGDYMTPPPAEWQQPFHSAQMVDTSTPYTHVLPQKKTVTEKWMPQNCGHRNFSG